MAANDAGQLWSGTLQIGKEVTAGTAVAATRKLYTREPALTIERDPRVHRFATTTRDNVRAYTNGPVMAGGSLSMPMSADEILEMLLIGVQGAVTPTTPAGDTLGRLWTFKPAGALDSATLEWADGARTWQGAGFKGNSITITGAANEANDLSIDLFGNDVVAGSLTGALSERVPTFFEGWQTRLYIDLFAGTPGTTPVPGVLRNWNVSINNNLARVYTADNTLAANRITAGELDMTAQFTFDAYASRSLTEFNNWAAGTQRLVRLEFQGPADEIEAGANEVQTLTTTGTPAGGDFTLVVLGQTTGVIAFDATAGAVATAINAALAVLGTGHTVGTSGGPLPAGIPITFSGAQVSGRDIPAITVGTNSLTGGTTPAPAIAQTTPGRSGRKYVAIDLPGAWTAVNIGGSADGVRTYEFSFQPIYQTTIAAMGQILCHNARTAAYA
jgi:hypothetical protein